MDDKLKIGGVEGSAGVILELIKDNDVDLSDLMNAKKKVHVPLFWLVIFIVMSFVLSVAILLIPSGTWKLIVAMADVIIGVIILGMVYIEWKSKMLVCIVTLGEVILFALSLGIYTPKDVVKKAEDVIETTLK